MYVGHGVLTNNDSSIIFGLLYVLREMHSSPGGHHFITVAQFAKSCSFPPKTFEETEAQTGYNLPKNKLCPKIRVGNYGIWISHQAQLRSTSSHGTLTFYGQ